MLSAMMLCSSVQITVAAPEEQQTVTLGQLLAQNYGAQLSDRAKALLTSGYLADDVTYSFTAPDPENGDGLVTVDPEGKTVEARLYHDGSNTWAPASAAVMVDGTAVETVTMTAGNGLYTGAFAYEGGSYSLAVTYALYTSVDVAAQNRMLDAPNALRTLSKAISNARSGVYSLQQSLKEKNTSSVLFNRAGESQKNKPLYNLLDISNYYGEVSSGPKQKGLKIEGTAAVYYLPNKNDPPEWLSLMNDLTQEMIKNNGSFSFVATLDTYLPKNIVAACSDGSIQEKGIDANQKVYILSQLLDRLEEILNGDELQGVNGIATAKNLVGTAKSTLKGAQANTKELAQFEWSRVSNLFATTLSSSQKSEIDNYVNNLTDGDMIQSPTVDSNTVLISAVPVTATVSQATVRVAIDAEVYPDGASSSTHLSDATTLYVGTGTKVEQLEGIIAQQGIETAALTKWNEGTPYSIGEEHYTRHTELQDSQGQPPCQGQLEEKQTYELRISYTPKTYAVTAVGCGGDIANDKYPYGYTFKLPEKLDDANHVYDYTVNGQPYDQGDTVRVTEDTTITRRVGRAWEKLTWGQVAAEAYLSANPQAASVLTSDALHTGAVRWRYPSSEDLLFSGRQQADGLTLFAQTFAADESATRLWKPVSIAASGEEVAFEKTGSIYQAELSGKPDDLTASYELALSFDDISQEAAQELVNLPAVLSANATRQLSAMNKLAEQEDNLEEVGKRIDQIRSTIMGDEDISAESKDLIDEVYDECTGIDGAGNTYLIIYSYVHAYNQQPDAAAKLAYYYQNYDAIYAQVDLLYENLTGVLEDEAVRKLLETNEATAEYYDRLDEAVEEGTESKADLIRPDSRIDTRSASLTDLTARILAVKDTPQVSVTAPPTLSAAVSVSAGALLPLDCSGIAAFGKCGDTLYWTLDELGCLTIFGEGDMAVYASAGGDYAPWHVLADRVQSVFITSAAVPDVSQEAFLGVNAQVYYPDMAAWKEADLVGRNLGGKLTWQTCRIGNLDAPGSDVDVRDMAALFTYLSMGTIESTALRTAPALFEELADVNRDGSVNILDYQVLYQQIRGQ